MAASTTSSSPYLQPLQAAARSSAASPLPRSHEAESRADNALPEVFQTGEPPVARRDIPREAQSTRGAFAPRPPANRPGRIRPCLQKNAGKHAPGGVGGVPVEDKQEWRWDQGVGASRRT